MLCGLSSIPVRFQSMPPPPKQTSRWFPLALVTVGSFGFAAAWVLLASVRNQQCSWMAVLAAIDAVLLLRMAKMSPGWARGMVAVAATAASIVLANWGIAAAQIGKAMGLLPWQALAKQGLEYSWTLSTLANGPTDLAWLAGALLLALLAGR